MAVSTKIIKRRIRSVGNTKKITKAMELVSAAKMRKAVRNTLASRAYAGTAWEIVLRLSEKAGLQHQFFRDRNSRGPSSGIQRTDLPSRIVVILISSNRGLCGAFNTNVAKRALQQNQESPHHPDVSGGTGQARIKNQGVTVDYLTLGKKARDVIRRSGATISADFDKQDVTTAVAEISALAHTVIDGFTKGVYDRVSVAYTHFISSLRQEVVVKQLLPIESADRADDAATPYDYLFEPSPATLFNDLLPRLITLQVYQATLESDASEHSARMLAMRNATDAAGDMIADLTLSFNQARQAGITQEIAEISGGKAALEN